MFTRSRSCLAALLVAALALAGCLQSGEEAPVATEGEPTAPANTQAPAVNTSVTPEQAALASNGTLTVEPLSMAGKTWGGACAWTPVAGQCEFPLEGTDNWRELDANGAQPLFLKGTLTWTPSPGGAEELGFYLYVKEGDAYMADEGEPMASGTSPLAIDFDLSSYPPGTEFMVAVSNWEYVSAMVAGAGYQGQQEFTFEGEWAHVTVPAAPAGP